MTRPTAAEKRLNRRVLITLVGAHPDAVTVARLAEIGHASEDETRAALKRLSNLMLVHVAPMTEQNAWLAHLHAAHAVAVLRDDLAASRAWDYFKVRGGHVTGPRIEEANQAGAAVLVGDLLAAKGER